MPPNLQSPLLCTEPQRSHDTLRVSAREGYDLWAATYDAEPNPLLALEERGLRPMLPGLEGKDALDIGCGTGRWLSVLHHLGARSVLGVDSSAAMIVSAAAKRPLRGRLIRGDGLALPLRARLADLVVCSFMLGHISSPRELARELARVSRPRADLFVTDMHPEAPARGWRCAFRRGDQTVEIRTCIHAAGDIRSSFEAEGFKFVKSAAFHVGEPERRIFWAARREDIFQAASAVPAVLIQHFRRG